MNSAEKGPATIVMANVRYTDLENILHFIYRGQVNVRKEDLNKFLETGEQLQIDGLMGQQASAGNRQNNSGTKRRFSEGGVRNAAQQLVNNRNVARNSLPAQQQTQYKIVSDRTGTMASRTSASGTNSQVSNHGDPKKPRTSGGIGIKQESASITVSTNSRRPSTSSHVSTANSSNSPSHMTKVDEVDTELVETNNGIKIMTVASMNAATPTAGYDSQGNEVYEILDYDGEDVGDMDMDGEFNFIPVCS